MVPGTGWTMRSGVLGSTSGLLKRSARGLPDRTYWTLAVLAPALSASRALTAVVVWDWSFSHIREMSSSVVWAMATPAFVTTFVSAWPILASFDGSMGDCPCLAVTMISVELSLFWAFSSATI